MRSEYIAAIVLGFCLLVSVIVLVAHNAESDRKIREELAKRDASWAKAVDSVMFYRDKTYELYEAQLAEKDKRIEELEMQVATNEAIMTLVNVIEPIRGKINGTERNKEN